MDAVPTRPAATATDRDVSGDVNSAAKTAAGSLPRGDRSACGTADERRGPVVDRDHRRRLDVGEKR